MRCEVPSNTPILAVQFFERTMSLFAATALPPGVTFLRGVARAPAILEAVELVLAQAPLRRMETPRGPMSVTMSNCGSLGWTSDVNGYRYTAVDPLRQTQWPAMPEVLARHATQWAELGGFANFEPDACLINQYLVGTQMGLHQDRNEQDFTQPIVSVSLGLPAVFLVGGLGRRDPKLELPLEHGDVVVFGGQSRRIYHGIKRLAAGTHATVGARRLNLTFRRAGHSP